MESNEIKQLHIEIQQLEEQLREKKELLNNLKSQQRSSCPYSDGLLADEVVRYSRQMLIPTINARGQLKLKKSSVLIVGIGGLGCPAALYLAASGIGKLTLLDYDDVELSNLHRQILHSELTIGKSKVESAAAMLHNLNSNIEIIPLHMSATGETMQQLFNENKFDVVLDGTDNVATRYLLNDICVFNKVPLVSGSAVLMEGQLTVYNYENGPCYRCLFPVPPPPETVSKCGDNGVIGMAPGVIGLLQALETVKILTNMNNVISGQLLVFDATACTFLKFKLRGKKIDCDVCGNNPKILEPIDYEAFCSSKAHDKVEDIDILTNNENISIQDFVKLNKPIVLDVRSETEYGFCRLPDTINYPITEILDTQKLPLVKSKVSLLHTDVPKIYFICRRGNDSQRAIEYLKAVISKEEFGSNLCFVNVRGGLRAYAKFIDSNFPVY